jgi:hypothetical protein
MVNSIESKKNDQRALTSALEIETVSRPEAELLALVREVGYGELLFATVLDEEEIYDRRPLSVSQSKLIALVRENPFIDCIKVHAGEPVQVIVSGESHGIKYKKKIQL